jgi:hypothetical protein
MFSELKKENRGVKHTFEGRGFTWKAVSHEYIAKNIENLPLCD